MRIIAGEFRSRIIASVPGKDVRPTPDRMRETLFNILAPHLDGAVFLDAYAGSGSVGIEALSRGAASAIFIENSKDALGVIDNNLSSLQLKNRAQVLRGPVRKKLTPGVADVVFFDPPYSLEGEYEWVLSFLGDRDRRARIVVAQHARRSKLGDRFGNLERYREVVQGDNSLSFYRPTDPDLTI